MRIYVDTSAAAKLVIQEAESDALARYLDASDAELASSVLLETELRRMAVRHELSQAAVSEVLDRFDLVDPDHAMFVEAGLLPGKHLRSLDAVHIAVANRIGADAIIAYDTRLCESARAVGMRVVAPA